MPRTALVWLRRDLRCDDHAALYHALRRFQRVYCAFVFDTDILDALPTRCDRRVEFIHASVLELHQGLQQLACAQRRPRRRADRAPRPGRAVHRATGAGAGRAGSADQPRL